MLHLSGALNKHSVVSQGGNGMICSEALSLKPSVKFMWVDQTKTAKLKKLCLKCRKQSGASFLLFPSFQTMPTLIHFLYKRI